MIELDDLIAEQTRVAVFPVGNDVIVHEHRIH
jgi:hypothetical protein